MSLLTSNESKLANINKILGAGTLSRIKELQSLNEHFKKIAETSKASLPDYLNPRLIIVFLKAEKVVDSVVYDTKYLRDTINRLNSKIKNGSNLKDNFLIFDSGKISINKTIKLI